MFIDASPRSLLLTGSSIKSRQQSVYKLAQAFTQSSELLENMVRRKSILSTLFTLFTLFSFFLSLSLAFTSFLPKKSSCVDRAAGGPWDSPELFEQRGGIRATDLAQRDRRTSKRRSKESDGRREGKREGKSKAAKAIWKPVEEMNLTREEREQRFRAQIQSPVTLTTFIKRAQTPEELMWTITTAMDETMLNHIHIAAAFNRLASLKKTTPLVERITKSPTLVLLAKQAARVADRREFRARELANMLMACAALRTDLPWISEELGNSLAKWVPEQASDMNPQALANTVYGLGVLDLGDDKEVSSAVEACARVIPMQLGRFSSMDVAQVAWGIGARDGQEDAGALMEVILKWLVAEAPSMSVTAAATDLPMIAVAFARLRNPQMATAMGAIAERLSRDLSNLRLWSLAALLWSWKDVTGTEGFLKKLQRAAKVRHITQEDIDRAPTGPKGETSMSWSKKPQKGLSVVETF